MKIFQTRNYGNYRKAAYGGLLVGYFLTHKDYDLFTIIPHARDDKYIPFIHFILDRKHYTSIINDEEKNVYRFPK